MSMPSSRLDVATSAGRRPALSSSSICEPLLAGDAAVVGADELLAGQLVEPLGEALGEPAAVGEDDRAAVAADELEDPRVDRRPDARPQVAGCVAGPPGCSSSGRTSPMRGHVVDRDDDLELERLARAGVDDRRPRGRARRRRGTGRSSRAAVAWRTARSAGSAGAVGRPRRRRARRLEPLEAQREVRAALRAGDRVDLVDDDVLDAAEDLAGRAREHQVERLGRRDQDVRRVAGDLAPVLGGRVARPAGDRDVRRPARPAARPPGRSRSAAPAGCARRRRSGP